MAGIALRKRFTYFTRLPLEIRLIIWELALPGPRLVNIRQRPLRKTFLDYKEEMGHEWPLLEDGSEDVEGSHELDEVWNAGAQARDHILLSLITNAAWDGLKSFHEAHMLGINSNCPPPAIMLVCRESYQVVSSHYTKAFTCMGSNPVTYFNFAMDTLFIRLENFAYYHVGPHRPLSVCVLDGLTGYFKIADSENVRRVQNLAITVPIDLPSRPLREILDTILVVFEGVKEISLIVSDKTSALSIAGTQYPVGIGEDCLIDPVHFRNAIVQYYRCGDDIFRGKMRQLRIPQAPGAELITPIVERVEAKWKSSNARTRLQFPKIQMKTLVNPIDKRDFYRAVSHYNAALSHHEQKLREGREAAGICSDDALPDDEF